MDIPVNETEGKLISVRLYQGAGGEELRIVKDGKVTDIPEECVPLAMSVLEARGQLAEEGKKYESAAADDED